MILAFRTTKQAMREKYEGHGTNKATPKHASEYCCQRRSNILIEGVRMAV